MKKIILAAIFILSVVLSSAAQETQTVTIEFNGMKSDKGDLYIALYNSEDSFLKKPLKGTIAKVIDKKATVVFKDIAIGTYAISAFHDANNNKKMDTNFFGIPKEPIGISNDATGFMGPPKYKNAKFKVLKNIKLSIKIN
ncbi:DUF2141 domain-containing protein [Tenacibaculum bernardetii]|uniref:DUF2141 domain-containing protein n=1 Tax=Tenacibaculum bernardetii TaxID=3021375 RepID=UPI0023B0C90B|nr:DUF2141 domain-containing protein [Tenacibaculum bernardetii]